jgi:transglutaminase-like putative cysteine protease
MIDKPVEGVHTVARSHPAGSRGAKISLAEVAERAWQARMSPRLRAWVSQVLDRAGVSRGGRREKAKAILDECRKKIPYMSDPVMGEFMATPEQILCLDKDGLCIIAADCDEFAILLAAAMLCIGIPAMIVGTSHRPPVDVPTHVLMAFQDEADDWVRMDGTTNHPVGQTAQHLREWWLEPGKAQKDTGTGDFVGMSEKAAGDLSGPASMLDLLYPNIRR